MGCISSNRSCSDSLGCPSDQCPDFVIRRHDTKPDLKYDVEDCDGPIDLTDLVCEVSMWARAKLKKAVAIDDTYFGLADNIGFEQIFIGDIIVVDKPRAPEQMIVTGFDENNKLVQVQRGYNGSAIGNYSKGTTIRIFRILNAVASTEMVKEDITQVDGTVTEDVITRSSLVYSWMPNDTCLPGCYWFEFKLLKMLGSTSMMGGYYSASISAPISFISYASEDMGCDIGDGVDWVQRFPAAGEGLLIKITDSPTAENVIA